MRSAQEHFSPNRSLRRLMFEEFEARLCLSTVSFASHDIVERQTNRPVSALAVDVDGDGDVDVVSASEGDHKIAWYENIDGRGEFGLQKLITTEADGARSVHAADLDGDGDVDILSASSGDHKIAWYENTDGRGNFGEQQVITTAASRARSVYAADLDSDGDVDVLSASWRDSKIAWYENIDGEGSFGSQQVISTEAAKANSVHAADMDGDGDVDVLSAHAGDDKIAWYENINGQGSFGQKQVVSGAAGAGRSVFASDVDGDGDMDVLAASVSSLYGSKIVWYENTDNKAHFGEEQVISPFVFGAFSVHAADIDGDGDNDAISASYGDNRIAWYENLGNGRFGAQQLISTSARNARSVYAADMDGDGDLDVLSASKWGDKISWYENADSRGAFGPRHVISAGARFAQSVHAADIDGDGDVDVVSASSGDFKIAWYENIDGSTRFGPQQVISISGRFPQSVYTADVDGDGDADVLSASAADGKIAWYENTDGKGAFGPQEVITTTAAAARSVYATDLDADGDVDILSASEGNVQVAWYENMDGRGNFGLEHVITTNAARARSVYAADLDGDGDMDALSAVYAYGNHEIAWYENTDGMGTFDEPQPIVTGEAEFHSVYAADLDGDGDADVVSASDGNAQVVWYENTDGRGKLWQSAGHYHVSRRSAVGVRNGLRR